MYDVVVNQDIVQNVIVDDFQLTTNEMQDLLTFDDISMTVFAAIFGYVPDINDVNYLKYKQCIQDIINTTTNVNNYIRAMGVV